MAAAELRHQEAADVYKKDRRAATLRRTGSDVEFRYTDDYLGAKGPAIASTLPLSPQPLALPGGAVPPFFAGLLPEGARLTALTRRLKTSADDMLSLLLAVGADTVGDVRVVPEGAPPPEVPALARVESWDDVDFAALLATSVGLEPSAGDPAAIPGVQDKLSAEVISLPVGEGGGHWILKLSPPAYPRLVENEAFFLSMARGCGLPVPHTEVVADRHGVTGLLVERFDRALWNGAVVRLAQEDACQLLGRYPADKYRGSYLDAARALLAASTVPAVDALELVRLYAFSYLIGNGDLHAKNVSVGERLSGDVRVTPMYDLLSTIAYIPDDPMALGIEGGDRRLRRRHLLDFAERIKVRPRAVERALDTICEEASRWIGRVADIGLDEKSTERLRREMAQRRQELSRAP
jgi:serine/threonine-protein kinase HipA